jgi:RHS repeat-associated protein
VGNLQGYRYPNSVQTGFAYNSLNRLTNVTISNGSTLASYAYTLGPTGNRTQVTESGGRQVNYTYDALYRLTGETIAGGSVNGTIGYTYDSVGNRLSRTSTVSPVPAATSTYDANDRLNSDTYDQNGNTTASGGNSFTYDFQNHLLTQNSTAVAIVYDGDGNRVSKTAGGTTTEYLVDDRNLTGYSQVLEEISSGSVQRVYTYGLNRISQSQASATSFYGYDGHGSVRLLTDATGAITDRYDYDAFGNVISQSGTTSNVYQYSGEQNDSNLGFYYLRARWLNVNSGRFLTVDPLDVDEETPQSTNRYDYAFNRPTDLADPSGNWPTYIHNQILADVQRALSNYISQADLTTLEQVSANQDALWFSTQQFAFNSYQHHMRAFGQDEASAAAEYQSFLDLNLSRAGTGDITALGKIFHAISDGTSPAHSCRAANSPLNHIPVPECVGSQEDFRPWSPTDLQLVFTHISEEQLISPGQEQDAVSKLVDYYRTSFVPRTLILKASVQSLQQQIAWNELLPSQVSLALTLAALGLPVGAGF